MKLTKANWRDVFKAKLVSQETMELKGYELVEELFVDSSGFGSPNEPALTQSRFEIEMLRLLEQHGSLFATITGAGQFQVYVGLFKKTGKSKCKKIGNNTLLIDYGNGKTAVRLHDTDILTVENGKIMLNSGGWQTHTTKKRLNKYLSLYGFGLFQKDFDWYVERLPMTYDTKKALPFSDGMTLSV